MPTVNQITLLGHLGADPELRFTNKGRPVCHLRLATNRAWRDERDEWQEETEWHRVVAYGPLAERTQGKAIKGDLVFVDGRMHYSSWTADDGVKRTSSEVVARRVLAIGRAGRAGAQGDGLPEDGGAGHGPASGDERDDIPF